MTRLRVGDWLVDPDHLRLTGVRGAIRVRRKEMALLMLLAQRAPHVVLHEQIMAAVWDRVVVPNVLPVAIARLRAALGDGALIENVRGQGYRLVAPVEPVAEAANFEISPYRGLAPFVFDDSLYFCGRQAAVREIMAALDEQQSAGSAFVLVLGASGGGKTSVIQAGVLPAIVRNSKRQWHHAIIDCAQSDPLVELAAWAHDDGARATRAPAAADPEGDWLLADPRRAAAAIAAALSPNGATQETPGLLLFFDHLENLFDDETWQAERRERLLQVIGALARSGCAKVLGAMRSDCYARCAESPALLALMRGHGHYHLAPPTAAETSAIIERPASAVGLRFEVAAGDGTRLDAQLLADAAGAPDVLPLLQYALAELFERRGADGVLRFDAYRALGGLAGCLAQRAEAVFASLSAVEKAAFPVVLASLARPTAEGFARRRRLLTDHADETRRSVIEAFVDARLFVTALSDDGATVAAAHDALFRNWPRAADVLRQWRHRLAVLDRLSDATRQWEHAGRSDAFCLAPGPLAEARQLRGTPEVNLEPAESAFLLASERRQKTVAHLRIAGIAALVSLTLALGVAASVGFNERNRAEREAAISQEKSAFLVSLFSRGDPGQVGRSELTARAMLDAAARRLRLELASDPIAQAAVMHSVGLAYMNIGALEPARPLLEDALSAREKATVRNPGDLVESLNGLGKLAYYQSRHDEALARYTRALDLATSDLGADHAETAQTLNNLGELRLAQARHDLALQFHERALETRRRLYGDEHGQVASSWHNLAGVHRQAGRQAEAETLYRRAVAIQQRFYGDSHLETAMGLSNLALLLTEKGGYKEAAALHQRALDIRLKILNAEHPHVAHSLHNLGALLVSMERFAEAEPVIRQSIESHLAIFGPKHMAVPAGQNNLATLLAARGELREAEDLMRSAVRAFEALNGPRHPNVGFIQTNLADVLNRQARYAEARPISQQALEILVGSLKKDHWRVAVARSVAGETLSGLRQPFDADELLVATYETVAASLGPHSRGARRAAARAFEHFKRNGNTSSAERFAALVEVSAPQ